MASTEVSNVTPERHPLYYAYGLGSVAFGIKNYAFSYLLLLYSTHVLGIPGRYASYALAFSIVWDAVTDLLLGQWTDKTRSRLGRRHPFMYASVLILPLSFYALFNPLIEITPDNGVWYLLIFSILVRTGTTLVEVPSVAQLPELEKDYDHRSRWLGFRQAMGWYGGNGIHIINFLFWVPVFGFSAQRGYTIFAGVAAVVMAISILVTSLGTQRHFASLPLPNEGFSFKDILNELRQIVQSLKNRNFGSLFAYGVISGVAGGLSTALYLYNTRYFFGFSGTQVAITGMCVLVSPLIAYFIGTHIGSLYGKKRIAIATILFTITLYPVPYVCQLNGLWPPLGSNASLALYSFVIVVEVVCIVINAFMLDSMMADVVEDSEINTTRRSEGLFFATRAFGAKAISAGGVIFAGQIVSFVGLDGISEIAQMTDAHRFKLAVLFLPLYCSLFLIAVACILAYRINRDTHNENLDELEQRYRRVSQPGSS